MTAVQERGDALTEILYDPQIEEEGLVPSWERVTGGSRRQLLRGKELRELNSASATEHHATLPRRKRKDAIDLKEEIWLWFHTSCAHVEINKADKKKYQNKKVFVAGQWRWLTCEKRVLTCSKAEAVQHFFESEYWLGLVRANPGLSASESYVQECICYCMKPMRGSECVCPVCIEYEEALRTWHGQRVRWHRGLGERETCGCVQCEDPASAWRRASIDFSNLRAVCLCPKVRHPGLELPHAKDETPSFYDLGCCKLHQDGADSYPYVEHGHMGECTICGWARKLAEGRRCKVTYCDKPVIWRRYKDIPSGDARDKTRKLVPHHGTRRELLEWLEERSKYLFYHIWLWQWCAWQKKLCVATFHRTTEIVVVIDWAAVYEMKGDFVGTCERPVSCKQLVAIVLYLPGATKDGMERAVQTDCWRWWTDCRKNARFNMLALREIVYYYKYGTRWSVPNGQWSTRGVGQVPNLARILLFGDGCTSENKGRFFFGRMAQAPHPDVFQQQEEQGQPRPLKPGASSTSWGCGVELCLEVGAPHHNSNIVDSVGKDARRAMDNAVLHDRLLTIFDFAACYRWCVTNMAVPSEEHAHEGTYGCNGRYLLGALSSGEFPNPDGFPVLDTTDECNFPPLRGSNQLFSFRGLDTSDREVPHANELSYGFVPCFCAAYLQGDEERCPYRHICGSRYYARLDPIARPRRQRRTRRRRADSSSSEED